LDNWIIHLDFHQREVLVIDEKDEQALYADMVAGKISEGYAITPSTM
jgi:hypothetical protein